MSAVASVGGQVRNLKRLIATCECRRQLPPVAHATTDRSPRVEDPYATINVTAKIDGTDKLEQCFMNLLLTTQFKRVVKMIARLAATAALCAAAASAATNPLSVTVNADGSYSVQAGFATFASGETGVMQNGAWLSSKTGGLTAGAPTTGTGSDAWGSYTSTAVSWSSSTGVAMHTVFRTYVDVPAIVFEQTFPDGDLTTGATEKQKDDLASSFPSFALPTSSNLGELSWRREVAAAEPTG